MGKSYEEKLIENTNDRIKAIENRLGVAPVITKVVDAKGKVISIQIEENGLSLNGKF
jgi:predicted metal-dependent hydrolase